MRPLLTNLFSADLHVIGNSGENCGLDKETLSTDALATKLQLGPFSFACLDVGHHSLQLSIADLGTIKEKPSVYCYGSDGKWGKATFSIGIRLEAESLLLTHPEKR